jgi:hypothetical protein
VLVYSPIEAPEKTGHGRPECVADAQDRPSGNRPPLLDLLPVPARKPEVPHVFDRVIVSKTHAANSLRQNLKECEVINHIFYLVAH